MDRPTRDSRLGRLLDNAVRATLNRLAGLQRDEHPAGGPDALRRGLRSLRGLSDGRGDASLAGLLGIGECDGNEACDSDEDALHGCGCSWGLESRRFGRGRTQRL